MTNALVQGQADWGGTYIANAEKTYLSRSNHYNYWAPLAGTDGLIPNLERGRSATSRCAGRSASA